MMSASFELPVDVLRARQNVKWARYGADVLPAWVAEMDFSIAHPIRRVIEHAVADQDFGYPERRGGDAGAALADAFARRMQLRFGWAAEAALVQPITDLVQGTYAAIMAFSDPGDGVLLQTPAYPPFYQSIAETRRALVALPLPEAGRKQDFTALAQAGDARTRVLLLCNPQNPTGHVFSRAELEEIGRIAIARDLVIVSDEIHADLVYDGAQHIPIASLSPEIAARTVTMTSATKSFNIPGLRCGVMHFGTAALRERFHARLPGHLLGAPGIIGIDATIAAWTHGQPWLDEVLAHLHANRALVDGFIAAELPGITWQPPAATYLGWLDCSGLRLPTGAFDFFHERARVAFSAGEVFDPARPHFVRLNFATSTRILEQLLGRVKDAVRRANATPG
ncbi:MAG: aminotransferase class I/II-fold pyridoxal phosphate-dependent enzyme [Rhodospirillales bacterium]|nr:aminotransferase class I/II-fold pyridoxal phosphate-dependent enzyme [Rhodospirillales bacterium]